MAIGLAVWTLIAGSWLTATGASGPIGADSATPQKERPAARYWVYVANESSDLVSRIRFGPEGAVIENDIPIGLLPTGLDGAHGVRVEPGGEHVYVSVAHGTPFGSLWKFRTGSDVLVDTVTLGLFPATIGITPDASLAFVANFNLHGDPEPSAVSAVYLPRMEEVARIETCVRPHGARVNHAGSYVYSVCVADDQLIEISVADLAVNRRVSLRSEAKRPPAVDGPGTALGRCGPTWVVPSHDDRRLYVACNARGDVLEIDAADLRVSRRFRAGAGPYNLAVTSDGRLLLATNKGAGSISVFDSDRGTEIARIPTSQPVSHGVAITPDDRYAFVSNEAIGATPGTVDVVDLAKLERVASVPVHHQPGGIDVWKMEPIDR